MRYFFSVIFCFILISAAKSQPTIHSLVNDEYCPNTEYTFTVTITKPYLNMIGGGGCYVTQLPASPVGTTFTFKGKFADANQKQSFRINYTDGTSNDLDFKKIKSFHHANACSQIAS